MQQTKLSLQQVSTNGGETTEADRNMEGEVAVRNNEV